MKLIDLINMKPVIEYLLDIETMPFAIAYRLTSLVDILNTNTDFYTTKLRDLLDKYGEKDENGELIQTEDGNVQLVAETAAEFNDKFIELQSVEVPNDLPKFTLEEFNSVHLAPRQVYLIRPLITE